MTSYKEPLASWVEGRYSDFNIQLAVARVKIEHCFGILKNRWRSLQEVPVYICGKTDHM
ncbi:hypothetical protein C7212DRAFT_283695 [Tuber magnatum]|uniref:DDE Tnp4 domain-containing protein n=1 Tax=Tuber magnatum TaxID=42249 RepID=A0A317SI63_9PEZI|nr:hypothetical protein C7212DRAFT_283695 [Tuber magnatum]